MGGSLNGRMSDTAGVKGVRVAWGGFWPISWSLAAWGGAGVAWQIAGPVGEVSRSAGSPRGLAERHYLIFLGYSFFLDKCCRPSQHLNFLGHSA